MAEEVLALQFARRDGTLLPALSVRLHPQAGDGGGMEGYAREVARSQLLGRLQGQCVSVTPSHLIVACPQAGLGEIAAPDSAPRAKAASCLRVTHPSGTLCLSGHKQLTLIRRGVDTPADWGGRLIVVGVVGAEDMARLEDALTNPLYPAIVEAAGPEATRTTLHSLSAEKAGLPTLAVRTHIDRAGAEDLLSMHVEGATVTPAPLPPPLQKFGGVNPLVVLVADSNKAAAAAEAAALAEQAAAVVAAAAEEEEEEEGDVAADAQPARPPRDATAL